jgi:hypothetical protein
MKNVLFSIYKYLKPRDVARPRPAAFTKNRHSAI